MLKERQKWRCRPWELLNEYSDCLARGDCNSCATRAGRCAAYAKALRGDNIMSKKKVLDALPFLFLILFVVATVISVNHGWFGMSWR